MKIEKFNDFLNENSAVDKATVDLIMKNIKFRNKDLVYWKSQSGNTLGPVNNNHDSLKENITMLLDMFEEYNEEEEPDEYLANRDTLLNEILALAQCYIQLTGDVDAGIFQAYISENVVFRKRWRDSSILVDANKKTGVFD